MRRKYLKSCSTELSPLTSWLTSAISCRAGTERVKLALDGSRCGYTLISCRQAKSGWIIIITYIYHVLINNPSAHTIHINLNTIFYTHVEDSPTETIYVRHYMDTQHTHARTHTHTRTHTYTRTHAHIHTHRHIRNWVLILVGVDLQYRVHSLSLSRSPPPPPPMCISVRVCGTCVGLCARMGLRAQVYAVQNELILEQGYWEREE